MIPPLFGKMSSKLSTEGFASLLHDLPVGYMWKEWYLSTASFCLRSQDSLSTFIRCSRVPHAWHWHIIRFLLLFPCEVKRNFPFLYSPRLYFPPGKLWSQTQFLLPLLAQVFLLQELKLLGSLSPCGWVQTCFLVNLIWGSLVRAFAIVVCLFVTPLMCERSPCSQAMHAGSHEN